VRAPLGPAQIRELIPHRYPFLLVDTIEELEAGVRAVGVKTSPRMNLSSKVTFRITLSCLVSLLSRRWPR
jgi:hypothetical protein